jgi:hypothetical protein
MAIGLGYFEFKTLCLPRRYYKRPPKKGERPKRSYCESLPRTTKAKLAPIVHADHRRRKIAKLDPEVLLAAELGQ